MSDIFKHLGDGQFPSAREYNRLIDAVSGLLDSTNVQCFSDSRGVHVRRMPTVSGGRTHALGLHGGGTPLAVANETLTIIPIDFTDSDPDGWMDGTGFVIPVEGMYFASAAFFIAHAAHVDVVAFVVGGLLAGGNFLKSVPEMTLSIAGYTLFHINGMVHLEQGDRWQYMFWHEAGGANTMEVSNALGAHAGIWLIERI